jgi:hypothetical protein
MNFYVINYMSQITNSNDIYNEEDNKTHGYTCLAYAYSMYKP